MAKKGTTAKPAAESAVKPATAVHAGQLPRARLERLTKLPDAYVEMAGGALS